MTGDSSPSCSSAARGPGRAKPILLLDVDGPLNPYRLITRRGHLRPKSRYRERTYSYQRHEFQPDESIHTDPYPVLISADHGAALNKLLQVFSLVWASTWEQSANTFLAPLLGIPELPYIEWPPLAREWTLRERHHGSWKTKHVASWLDEHAERTPWAWVDDEITREDRDWFHRLYGDTRGGPFAVERLLMTIHPKHGLREFDFDELCAWGIKQLGGNAASCPG
ncbi:HAD domain-containing protein [Enemella evansiae]|uniref:HAD domain-containing protein n=1 Tax=Enemella evansiae TaxID=2016499 RepID=UPI0015C68DD7